MRQDGRRAAPGRVTPAHLDSPGPPGQCALRPGDPSQRRAEGCGRETGLGEQRHQPGVGAVGLRRSADPTEGGCQQPHSSVRLEACHVPDMQAGRDSEVQLRMAQHAIDVREPIDLVPRRRHQELLVLLDDLGPELGSHARGGLEVELLEPSVVPVGVDCTQPGLNGAVPWRRQQWLVLAGGHRKVDDVGHVAAEALVLCLVGPGLRSEVDGSERTAQGEHGGVAAVRRDAALAHVVRTQPHALRQRPGPQQHRQRLEVAAGTGREAPVVVDGQLDEVEVRVDGPGRVETALIVRGDRLAESREAAQLERRHDTGEVVGVRLRGSAHRPVVTTNVTGRR